MDEDRRKKIALFKYGLIAPVLSGNIDVQMEYFREAAKKEYDVPYLGMRKYKARTFKSWLVCLVILACSFTNSRTAWAVSVSSSLIRWRYCLQPVKSRIARTGIKIKMMRTSNCLRKSRVEREKVGEDFGLQAQIKLIQENPTVYSNLFGRSLMTAKQEKLTQLLHNSFSLIS